MQLDLLFENDDLLSVYKPPGLAFHLDQQDEGFFTLVKKQFNCKDLYPVHRLDKLTSGVLIFAKNKPAARLLGQKFSDKTVEKTYLALSAKKPKKKQGKIVGDMEKSRGGSWKLVHSKNNPAITQFESKSLSPGIRFFWIKPKTGKTHQIRVALKSIGAPILGDTRYGGEISDRGYLHAYQIQFNWKDQHIKITSNPREGELFTAQTIIQLIDKFTNSTGDN